MLYEADRMLTVALGDFPSAFMMFSMGYIAVSFFEKWVHVVTTDYRSQQNGDADESGSWVVRSRSDIVRGNAVTASVLVLSCVIENFISTFAIGAQVDAGSLWTMAVMILSTEWIQIFMFVFQFQQCKRGMNNTTHATFNVELPHQETFSSVYDTPRGQRKLKCDTFVNVVIISATNTLGVFIGIVFNQLILAGNRKLQNTCAGLMLAFVAGVFLHLATSQMIVPEFESGTDSERTLLAKGFLIVVGVIVSSLMNVLVTLYL
jgi:hypothetical protein